MKNIVIFLDKWSNRIVLLLVLIIFLKTCSTNSKIEKNQKDLTTEIQVKDSIIKTKIISKEELNKMITIEGLKVEKRMIQSTDRKILDVNRQSEIDKEITELEK